MPKYKRTQEDWIKIGTSIKKIRNDLLHTYISSSRRLGKSHKDVKKMLAESTGDDFITLTLSGGEPVSFQRSKIVYFTKY